MYRAIIIFVKNTLDEEWKEILYQEESQRGEFLFAIFDLIEKVKKDYKYVREELERKDSTKTWVWEWTDGELTYSPDNGDRPCSTSRFIKNPNRRISRNTVKI